MGFRKSFCLSRYVYFFVQWISILFWGGGGTEWEKSRDSRFPSCYLIRLEFNSREAGFANFPSYFMDSAEDRWSTVSTNPILFDLTWFVLYWFFSFWLQVRAISAVFTWLSKLNTPFRLLRLMISLKISRQFFNQWEAKPRPVAPWRRDFPRLEQVTSNC